MKKALIITGTAGFLSQFELNDVKILKNMGYEIHYATNFGMPVYEVKDETLRELGIVLHHISVEKSPLKIRKNIWAYRELKRIIDREKIDLVHCHNPIGGAIGRLSSHMSDRKPYCIYTAHGFHFFDGAPKHYWMMYYPVERLLAHMTNMLITINHEDQSRAEKFKYKNGGSAKRIHSVGLECDKFKHNEFVRDYMRKRLDIPDGVLHLITAAELNKNKNQSVVIKAIKKLNNPNIRYTICGNGPYRNELENLVNSLELNEQVRIVGYRNDMEMMLQSADAFVFPSKREGMGMAALEAMASGLPVIAADNRGTREYMIDGVNGYVCDANSVNDFAQSIQRIIDNPSNASLMGQVGITTSKRFAIETIDGRMRELYTIADRKIESVRNHERAIASSESDSSASMCCAISSESGLSGFRTNIV